MTYFVLVFHFCPFSSNLGNIPLYLIDVAIQGQLYGFVFFWLSCPILHLSFGKYMGIIGEHDQKINGAMKGEYS